MSEELSVRLESCESVIERGLQTFIEVGQALAEIRDGRLYREQFETFEDYCRERWGWTRQYVNGQIRAAETVASLETIVSKEQLPTTESQARELSGLEPERAAEVMREAHEQSDGKVTAAVIRGIREQIAPKPPANGLISTSDLAELNTPPVTPPRPPDPPRRDLAQAMENYVASDPAVQRARLAKSFTDAWAGALRVTEFDQSEVAAVIGPDDWDTLDHVFGRIASWWEGMRAHRSRGLRIVGGTDV